MASEQLPFLLAKAREWWVVADILRASGIRPDDPALTVWREAAWCQLLFTAGKYAAALVRLRAVAATRPGFRSNPLRRRATGPRPSPKRPTCSPG